MATTYDPTTADAGVVQKVPAGKVVIDLNVRLDIRLDKSFVSSIRVYGFEQLPVGYFDDDGNAHVTIGQRRVSAALEIGWPVIPLIIKTKVDAEADRAEEQRILAQLTENEQRAPLTDSERAGGYKKLSIIGVTEDQIARKTNSPKQRVETALKVVDSKIASAEMEKHELTLDQAALLIEFEDDKKALAELRETAKTRPGQLEHVASSQRSRIARERHGQSVADKARADGWEVITRKNGDEWGYGMPKGLKSIRDLCRADDTSRKAVTVDDVVGLPDRVVVVDPRYSGSEADITWCIRSSAKHGFADRYSYSGAPKGPLTDEEKAERRQKRTDRAEMTDATIVRRQWLKDTFLPRKHTMDQVGTWILKAMYELGDALRYDQARDDDAGNLACELLGLEFVKGTYNTDLHATIEKALTTASTVDQIRILLALAIARVEYPAGNPKHHRFGQYPELGPYLAQLVDWGYTLADVEQRIADAAKKGGRK